MCLSRWFQHCDRNLCTDTYTKITSALKKQGMYDIRLKEKEVALLDGVPENLKVTASNIISCNIQSYSTISHNITE